MLLVTRTLDLELNGSSLDERVSPRTRYPESRSASKQITYLLVGETKFVLQHRLPVRQALHLIGKSVETVD